MAFNIDSRDGTYVKQCQINTVSSKRSFACTSSSVRAELAGVDTQSGFGMSRRHGACSLNCVALTAVFPKAPRRFS